MADDCTHQQLEPGNQLVRGIALDGQTRCAHYHTDQDVIAIKFACCETYYPCFQCHDACVDHDAERWPREAFDEPGVLCGVCGSELTAVEYLDCDHECPYCGAAFNPSCRDHHSQYFAIESAESDD